MQILNYGVQSPRPTRWLVHTILIVAVVSISPFLILPRATMGLFHTSSLPHYFCYLGNPLLVWTHVSADSVIGLSYFAISVTLAYLVHATRTDVPFYSLLLAFGLFIVACGLTHLMEVLTIWIPAYGTSAVVKLFTAGVSLSTAVVLPIAVPQIKELVQQAKATEQATARLRASEARKDALLQETHHRVKNNLAVICSLFNLQATHTKDAGAAEILREMQGRVHSMGLVHETLYGSENVGCLDFGEYAHALAEDILSSYGGQDIPVKMKLRLGHVIMNTDLAVLCGLMLNELISNAFKHGFPKGRSGEITVALQLVTEGECSLTVDDNGVGLPPDLDVNATKSFGLRLVRSLTRQVRGSFELVRLDIGSSARVLFPLVNREL